MMIMVSTGLRTHLGSQSMLVSLSLLGIICLQLLLNLMMTKRKQQSQTPSSQCQTILIRLLKFRPTGLVGKTRHRASRRRLSLARIVQIRDTASIQDRYGTNEHANYFFF